MFDVSLSQALKFISASTSSRTPVVRISILRNIMVETMEVYLRYFIAKIGFSAVVTYGNYDNVFQEAVGGDPALLNDNVDCVMVFQKLETLSWRLSRDFIGLGDEGVVKEIERISGFVEATLTGIRNQTNAMILWFGFETPIHPARGIVERQYDNGQTGTINTLNDMLRTKLRELPSAFFVDMDGCIARIGSEQFYDQRYWHIGKAPYSRQAQATLADESFKYIRALKGKNKKCLILDCDNTLWGGIIGEDGLAGISLGSSYPGSMYVEFQQEVINLYNRGVILALCSKNNEDDVWEVFRNHPDMLLNEDHISTAQINWDDKATNIVRIAEDLNIGLDSLVFVDDSDFEVQLVRQILSDVEVIHMASDKISQSRDVLAGCSLFDALVFSEEDKNRGGMYKAEARRKQVRSDFSSLESYFKSLEMIMTIRKADELSVSRIAQMTQRTNQFNLTTRRYSEADIAKFSSDGSSDVLYLRLQDKFGDYGIVGTCILTYSGATAILDTFLLSCRVIGRSVEDVFLAEAVKMAQDSGFSTVIGDFFPTKKNMQVKDFYQKHGFDLAKGDRDSVRYVYDHPARFDVSTIFQRIDVNYS